MNDLFKNRLAAGLVIFDGATGTEIYRRNVFVNASYEGLNLSKPKFVGEIHTAYVDAGVDVITTNTFNANRRHLEKFGLGNQVDEINRRGVAIAREAANQAENPPLVAGCIGPVAEAAEANDKRSTAELLKEQIQSLGEADFIDFESVRKIEDVEAILTAAESFPDLRYMVSFAIDREGTAAGEAGLRAMLRKITERGDAPAPIAIGLNCGGGPEPMLKEAEILLRLTKYPVIIQPNAGAPRHVDGRMLYMTSAEYFTTYAGRYVQLGAAGVGGCCGITPEHIADMARSIRPLANANKKSSTPIPFMKDLPEPAPLAERSKLGAKLAAGKFVVTIEVTPPAGFDLTKTIEAAKICRDAGIDAVNLPDGPRASARICPIAAAAILERTLGIETIPHCCCRDHSLIGLQAELLGYAGLGIHNLLFITGDPPKLGDYPFSTGVFDLDSIGLTRLQSRMNRGVDSAGKSINTPTKVVIGVGLDPNAIDQEREYTRICKKVEAGADFIVTQPVFAPEKLLDFVKRIEHLHVPIIAGIWPLVSLKNAEFMRTEVPGVVLPDSILQRMAAGHDRDSQREIGIEIARESLAAVKPAIQGVQLSAPFGNVNFALRILEE